MRGVTGAALLAMVLAAVSFGAGQAQPHSLSHDIAQEAGEVDQMVSQEDAAFAAQAGAAGAVAQQRTDRVLGRGDDSQGVLPPEVDDRLVAPAAMGGFELPSEAITHGASCVPTCQQPCVAVCSQHKDNTASDCTAVCAQMCADGCGKADEDAEGDDVGDGNDPADDMEDCVPGCMSDCTPSCMKEAKDAKTCASECNEFCDRDCSEDDDVDLMDPMNEEDEDGEFPGLSDSDHPDGGALDDLMFGPSGDDDDFPSGQNCQRECASDCGEDCKSEDSGATGACVRDCQAECRELCQPLKEDMAGNDGDKLLDLAEGGEEGTYDDEEEADDLDKGLDGRDPIKAPGGSSLAGERVLTMPRRSGGASRFGLWWTMLLAIFVATVTMLTYFYRHRAARLFRMPMSLNVV